MKTTLAIAFTLAAATAVAQVPPPKPCTAPESRQFDFWIGDGTVRQLWRVSADGGKTWKTSFDGKYVKAPDKGARGQAPR